MAMQEIVLKVNGVDYELKVRATATLADILREEIGLIGTKIMCNEGECGSCTVLLDGTTALSCLMLAVDCVGREILTIEGVADPITGDLHPLQQAFVENSGMQCGVCTPGMILTAKALIDEIPDPSEEDVREALSGNLCRCGNYRRITECVLDGARTMRAGGKDE